MKCLDGKEMVHRYEQVQVFSEAEWQRRVEAACQVMDHAEVGVLLILDGYWEGYSQWLAGTRNARYLVLTSKGRLFAVFDKRHRWFGFEDAEADIPSSHKADIVDDLEAVRLDLLLKKSGRRKLGFIHMESMTVELRAFLNETVPDAEFADITSELDPYKATKSEEELEAIAASVQLHEKVMTELPDVIRPGKTVMEIDREMRHLCRRYGSGNGECLSLILQAGNGRKGAVPYRENFCGYPDRKLEWGDQVEVLLETNGPGGHFSALGRRFSLGLPTDEDYFYWDLALKMQDFAAQNLKPGVCVREIYDKNKEYINSLGYETVPRNYLHSLGYCFGEKPFLFDKTERIPLRKDMVYIVHPYVSFYRINGAGIRERDEMYGIDTYRVTENGGVRQNHISREIIVLR